jgi:hypothetical protein
VFEPVSSTELMTCFKRVWYKGNNYSTEVPELWGAPLRGGAPVVCVRGLFILSEIRVQGKRYSLVGSLDG